MNATLTFRWKGYHGVTQLWQNSSCPVEFNASSGAEIYPATDSSGEAYAWTLPADPGFYYATSQAPGDCANGLVVTAEVIGSGALDHLPTTLHWALPLLVSYFIPFR